MTETPEKNKSSQSLMLRFSQVIVQWAPLGGSGWLLGNALWGHEWVQALAAFPLTALSAAWASYTETFVATLREEVGEWGKKDARSLARLRERFGRTIRWQLSGFERKYLDKQLSRCLYSDVEGYQAGGIVPLLEDVFVPLELSSDFSAGPSGKVMSLQLGSRSGLFQKKLLGLEALDIWDFLARVRQGQEYRQLAILAWGGFGKTTLLRHITAVYARGDRKRGKAPKLVPFFIRLRKWGTALAAADAPRLPEFLRDRLARISDGITVLA